MMSLSGFARQLGGVFDSIASSRTLRLPGRSAMASRRLRRSQARTAALGATAGLGTAGTVLGLSQLNRLIPINRNQRTVGDERATAGTTTGVARPTAVSQPLLKNTGPSIEQLREMRAKAQPATIKYYTDPHVRFIGYDGTILTPEQAAALSTSHGSYDMPYIAFSEDVSDATMRQTLAKYRKLGLIKS